MFHVLLNNGISKLSSDQSLGIEDRVAWVLGDLVFGCISDESFVVIEGDIGRSGSVSLIIGNDLNSVVLPDADTGVGGTEIDSDSFFRDSFITHVACFVLIISFCGVVVFNG